MKNISLKSNNNFTFSHPLFDSHPLMRSMSRVIYYVFFIVLIGFVVALLISGISSLIYLGIIILLVLFDYVLHIKDAPYSLKKLRKGTVPNNNLILCVERDGFYSLLSAFERIQMFGGDVSLYVLEEIIQKRSIEMLMTRLDVNIVEFRKFVEQKITNVSKEYATKKVNIKNINLGIKAILIDAVKISEIHSYDYINIESIFASVMMSNTSGIKDVLDRFSINPNNIEVATSFSRYMFSHRGVPKLTGGFAGIKSKDVKKHRVNRSFTSRPTPILDMFSRDITDFVRFGSGGFLIGHNDEYEQLVDVLSDTKFKSSVLIGDPGVGKESIVYHLAFNIVADEVPSELFDKRVVQLSIGDLIAGISDEKSISRMKNLSNEIINAGNIILYIPDIHNLSRTSDDEKINLSDIFIPIIRNADFPIIGSTTPSLYKQFIEMRSDFAGIFEDVRVNEISKQDALRILFYDAMVMEKKYKTTVSFLAIKRAVDLAERYIHAKPLPSSAQDILREAFSSSKQHKNDVIKKKDIDAIVEKKTKIPVYKASGEEARKLLNLEEYIHQNYINQEEAVKEVSDSLRKYRSGLSQGGGPISTFLFIGPTGVGKTELSKILSDVQFGSRKNIIRMDMSEFQQKKDIVKFIGSPDGKIVGRLTENIKQQPYSLILLDEFEKANLDVLNLFLQVFDEGELSDGLGNIIDFSNTIIIATSNAESVFIQDQVNKGIKTKDFSEELKQKLSVHFRPELLNRFSNIIVFRSLSLENIKKIAELKLEKLKKVLLEQGLRISFGEGIVRKIAEMGYDPKFGARPIDRAIDDHLTSGISKKILSGDFKNGDIIIVSISESDNFVFDKK